jgi:hypothetical protein
MNDHISELDWERFVLGELPEERSRILRDLLLGDPRLQRKVESLRSSNREDLTRYPSGGRGRSADTGTLPPRAFPPRAGKSGAPLPPPQGFLCPVPRPGRGPHPDLCRPSGPENRPRARSRRILPRHSDRQGNRRPRPQPDAPARFPAAEPGRGGDDERPVRPRRGRDAVGLCLDRTVRGHPVH